MTITADPTLITTLSFEDVTLDAYSSIHKCIRSVLFSTVVEIGSCDPASTDGRVRVSERVASVSQILSNHAHHEDGYLQPVICRELPTLADRITDDHATFDVQVEYLEDLARSALVSSRPRRDLHRLYVEFASFASSYLAHQDYEERVVMPALELAIGVHGVEEIHGAIVASIPPQEMADTLALMLPVINVDERVEMLAGIRAGAPAEAFAGVCTLAASVLTSADYHQLATRLHLL